MAVRFPIGNDGREKDSVRVSMKRRLIGTWSVFRVVRLLAIAYLTLCCYGWFLSERQVFLPPPPTYSDSDDILKLDVGNGEQISAMFLENPSAKYTVLMSHGNADDLGQIGEVMTQWFDLGYSVLAYDYRGYGTSDGSPREARMYEDVTAAFRYLTEAAGIPSERVIAHGFSLGGAPTLYLANRESLGGVIVEGTFTTVFRVVTRIPLVPFETFNNLARVRQLKRPLLVAHGRQDTVIPFRHGQRLFEAATVPKFFL
ncbi:MAG: alpha/beta hydrolase, partial [Cyanobacteria bacterium P01_E01_bin.45]